MRKQENTIVRIAAILASLGTELACTRPCEVGARRGAIAVAGRPGFITTNRMRSVTGRPMGVGRRGRVGNLLRGGAGGSLGRGRRCEGDTQASLRGGVGCDTYGAPPVIIGPDGCDIGYNGCGDTIGVNVTVPATTTADVNIPAAIEFTPRYFEYTGPLLTFDIVRIFVANGPNSNFGAGYSADYYALASFTSKRVSWPTFYNSPPLTITVTNLTGAPANFAGKLIGVASHQ